MAIPVSFFVTFFVQIASFCSMVSFPNCKINLGLNIVNKRDDGYHDIETFFFPVHLKDSLEIIEKENIGVVVDLSDHNAMIKAISSLEKLLREKVTVRAKVRQTAIRYRSFVIAEKIYTEIYT